MKIETNIYIAITMLLIFLIMFYTMIWYPQNKIYKEHKKIIENISINDTILTRSGIVGEIIKKKDKKYITILINNNTKILIKKEYILCILPKNTLKKI